jgi:tetratricopeptide (TPR) repeat protein
MGNGIIFKSDLSRQASEHTSLRSQTLVQLKSKPKINVLSQIYMEDIDDADNTVRNTRNSIHMDTITFADSMLRVAVTNEQKAAVFVMKGKHYYDHACKLLRNSNLDYFQMFRKALVDFEVAHSFDTQNTEAILSTAKCLIKLHQYSKALIYLCDNEANNKKLLESGDFWKLKGICSRKRGKIWDDGEKSPFKKSLKDLQVAQCYLQRALEFDPHDKETQQEKHMADNLFNLQEKYNKDIYKYLEDKNKDKQSYILPNTRSSSEKISIKFCQWMVVE